MFSPNQPWLAANRSLVLHVAASFRAHQREGLKPLQQPHVPVASQCRSRRGTLASRAIALGRGNAFLLLLFILGTTGEDATVWAKTQQAKLPLLPVASLFLISSFGQA